MSHASCPGVPVSALETESTRDAWIEKEGGIARDDGDNGKVRKTPRLVEDLWGGIGFARGGEWGNDRRVSTPSLISFLITMIDD
jgi:hypothetical protein